MQETELSTQAEKPSYPFISIIQSMYYFYKFIL